MSTSKNTQNTPENKPSMIFSKENYTLTLISLLIIIIGFFVMAGKEGDIYDFRRITLAPIIVIIGFVLGIYAIFFKKK
jgi:peptidoglycan/LPS O-acetylase OafA/YrhL